MTLKCIILPFLTLIKLIALILSQVLFVMILSTSAGSCATHIYLTNKNPGNLDHSAFNNMVSDERVLFALWTYHLLLWTYLRCNTPDLASGNTTQLPNFQWKPAFWLMIIIHMLISALQSPKTIIMGPMDEAHHLCSTLNVLSRNSWCLPNICQSTVWSLWW